MVRAFIIPALGKEGSQMSHTLKIGIGKDAPPDGGIVRCRKIAVRERFLRFLFGRKQRLTILVPGDSVRSLTIVEDGADG
jgi:hypothetical protein